VYSIIVGNFDSLENQIGLELLDLSGQKATIVQVLPQSLGIINSAVFTSGTKFIAALTYHSISLFENHPS
jgi:hypothetical protein